MAYANSAKTKNIFKKKCTWEMKNYIPTFRNTDRQKHVNPQISHIAKHSSKLQILYKGPSDLKSTYWPWKQQNDLEKVQSLIGFNHRFWVNYFQKVYVEFLITCNKHTACGR